MNRDFPVDFMPEKQTVTFRFVLFLFAFWSFVGVAKGQCTEPQGAFVNEVYCSGQVLNYDLQANAISMIVNVGLQVIIKYLT